MAHSTSPCSSEFDTELDLWAEFPDNGEDGPSENKPPIGQPADQSPDNAHQIKRSSSTEETPIDPIPHKSSEKRPREPDDQDKSSDRPLKIKSTPSHSPQTHNPSKSSPMNPKSSPINPPVATQNEDTDSQSLGNLTCAICLSAPSPAVVTKCGHVTCGECLASSIVSQHNSSLGVFPPFLQPVGARITNGICPVCRASLVGGWGTAMRGVILKVGKAP